MTAHRLTSPLFIPHDQLTAADHHSISTRVPIVIHTPSNRAGAPNLAVYRYAEGAHLRDAFLHTGSPLVSADVPDRSTMQSPMPPRSVFATAPSVFSRFASDVPGAGGVQLQPGPAPLSAANVAAHSHHFDLPRAGCAPTEARIRDAGRTPFYHPFAITIPSGSSVGSSRDSDVASTVSAPLSSTNSIRFDAQRMAEYRETHPASDTDSDVSPMELSPQYTLASPMSTTTVTAPHSFASGPPPANGLPTIMAPPSGAVSAVNYAALAPAPVVTAFIQSAESVPPSLNLVQPVLVQSTTTTEGAAPVLPATATTTTLPTHPPPGVDAQRPNPFAALLARTEHANTCCLYCRDIIQSIDSRADNIHRLLVCVSELTRAGTAYAEELQHQTLDQLNDIEDACGNARVQSEWLSQSVRDVFGTQMRDSFTRVETTMENTLRRMENIAEGIERQRNEDRADMRILIDGFQEFLEAHSSTA